MGSLLKEKIGEISTKSKKVKRFFIRHCAKLVLFLRNFKANNSILIFSETRSGSTWLMELLNQNIDGSIVNWEPLRPSKGVVPLDFRWGERPLLDNTNIKRKEYELLVKIITFKKNTYWTTRYVTNLANLFKSKLVITKFVRANRLLPIILDSFDFQHKPIVLVRHPIAVCLSQLKAFGNMWEGEVHNIVVPDCKNNAQYIENLNYINSLGSELEIQIAIWCLNNCHLFEDENIPKKCNVIFYENLVNEPLSEFNRILIDLGLQPQNIGCDVFLSPSTTDFKNDFAGNAKNQLGKTLDSISVEMKARIQVIFDEFQFRVYSAHSIYPDNSYVGHPKRY